jgi:hypothetical protein
MGRELRGVKGKDAIKAFLRAGGIERPGKGDHVNIKMPNGSNPSVSGVFIPLWQRGIKGDFKIMLVKSPLAPLFQRGV